MLSDKSLDQIPRREPSSLSSSDNSQYLQEIMKIILSFWCTKLSRLIVPSEIPSQIHPLWNMSRDFFAQAGQWSVIVLRFSSSWIRQSARYKKNEADVFLLPASRYILSYVLSQNQHSSMQTEEPYRNNLRARFSDPHSTFASLTYL